MLALRDIDRERERLHKTVEKWGLRDQRTICQSEKVDQMIYLFMTGKDVQNH
jgi:hypothetical protein